MSALVFPYGIRFQENGHIELFPAAEINILGPENKGIRALFHLDSGATTSILPESDADVLGVDLKAGPKIIVRGISGEVLVGYRHLVTCQFNQINIKIPVIFVESIAVPRILGREGLFYYFGILFDEPKNRTLFLDFEKKRRLVDSLFRRTK